MSDQLARRRPPPPLPTANGSSSSSSSSPATGSTGLKPTAPAFVPGGGFTAGASSTNSSALPPPPVLGMGKGLSAAAPSWQPKFASASNPPSPSGASGSGTMDAAAAEPSLQAVKAATAAISPDVAKAKAKTSQMSANATAFTPTGSGGGSFPSTPNKGGAISSAAGSPGTTPASLTTAKAAQLPPPPPPPPVAPATRLPDPFNNSAVRGLPERPAAAEALPLNTAWTLYADSKQATGPVLGAASAAAAAAAAQNETFEPVRLAAIADVESFWRLLRSVPTPASRTPRFTYYFFRKTIFPSWEEPRNKHGGTFSFMLWDSRTGSDASRLLVNDVWTLLLAGLAGENVDESLIVNGICIKVRTRITVEIWTNTCAQARVRRFVASLREMLRRNLPTFSQERCFDRLEFVSNETNAAKSAPPPPPPPPPGSPQGGKNSHGSKAAAAAPPAAATPSTPPGANDFTI